jgi:signal transduction histidine kinase
MNLFALSGFINGLVSIVFGSLIYFRAPKKLVNKTFWFLTISFSVWSFSYAIWQISETREVALFWVKILSAGSIFIPVTFLHWVLSLLKKEKSRKKILIFSYLISSVFLFFNFFSSLFIKEVSPQLYFLWWPQAGFLYTLYIIFIYIGIIGYACYELLKSYKSSTGYLHEQIKYILLAVLVGFGGGLSNFPLWYGIPIPPYGNFVVWLYPFILFYAISHYRLMNVRFILGKAAVYLFSLLSIVGFSFLTIFLNNLLAQPISFYFLGSLIIVFDVLVFKYVFRFFETFASKYFYYTFYSYQKVLTDLGHNLTKFLDLEKVTSLITKTLMDTMKLERTVILLRDSNTGEYKIQKNIGFKEENGISLVKDNFLTQHLKKTQKPLVYEELSLLLKDTDNKEEKEKIKTLQNNMKRIEAVLCMPLLRKEEITGMIVLGSKISKDPYSREDIDLLSTLSSQASIAIENARLYDTVEDLSKNLQRKVDEQTKELKEAYQVEKKAHQQLKNLSRAKDQFIMATQHHLRTPLTVMKGYSSMIIEGDYGKVSKKAKEKLEYFQESTEKLIRLVNSFLDISQFQMGKKVLKKKKISLESIIKEIIKELRVEAKEKGITLKLKKPKEKIFLKADKDKLKESFYNIIDNAVKYTEKGSVTIEIKKKKNKALLKVQDTGIGMTKEQARTLFSKIFERGKEAQKAHGLGKGIGLYIASNIIKAHKGKVWADSKGQRKGSTFFVELPLINE